MKANFGKSAQRGFTLIELIITIVIIGVLAAVAIPKFQDLTGDAEKGVAAGIAAALASGTSVNYGKSKVPGAAVGTDYKLIYDCATIESNKAALADIPSGYFVVGTATLTASGQSAPGTAVAGCGVAKSAGGTALATFNAYGAGTAP